MKAGLRQRLRARRRDFVARMNAAGTISEAAEAMAARVIAQRGEARTIATYWPAGSEADSRPAMLALHARGCVVALPHVTSPDQPMTFHRWQPGDTLHSGAHGLLQPATDTAPIEDFDLILTPLLGFDRRLMRLGQGAGYYDRLFARLPHIRRIGLAWSVQEVEEAPADPWDVPLHGVATELEWIEAEPR
ncbi:5-formyltetrahydrofolate cyclo-ligase [Sphingomonas laterariae]|uniref:5-formyltetrahydrofolate cyclo-ligase n=1 Tax=Edaphosphingomonas laterariae TaxID=861865 RepID=A0A239DXJ5_9SPHN|nr:5-formyltetrahydrofolate cyclo-ligase [Sphingomonas laterariae]SNS37170.1 5-formyltetrahydrofolate cyclo-ligase [Sphingomonas laterariae]